jgi:hypothetical protein
VISLTLKLPGVTEAVTIYPGEAVNNLVLVVYEIN